MVARDSFQSFSRRYLILEPLGIGGMGMVHRARDRLGGYVALKRLAGAARHASITTSTPTAVFSGPVPALAREAVGAESEPESSAFPTQPAIPPFLDLTSPTLPTLVGEGDLLEEGASTLIHAAPGLARGIL